MKKWLFGIYGAVLCYASTVFAADGFNWSNVTMGGGGFVSAVIASNVEQNVFYARTDVGGAYRWNETSAKWESMMDWVDYSELGLLGVEALAVDPSAKGTVYMMAGTSYFSNGRSAFLRSGDYGKSWEVLYTWDETGYKGTAVKRFGMHGNGMGRGNGEALAVDPKNSDNMFYGTRNKGLWKSTDNGSNWSHVDAWTKAAGSDTTWNGAGFSFVQYAPGDSKVLYAGFLREGSTSNGTFENVFTSTDGGASWKALPIPDALRKTSGGSIVRLMPQRAVVAKDGGKLTVTFADGAGPHSMMWDEGWGMIYDGFGRGAVLQYDVAAGTWSDVSPENFLDDNGDAAYDAVDVKGLSECSSSGKSESECESFYPYIAPYGGIAINPNNPDEMVVTTEGYRGPQFWYTATDGKDGKWTDQWGTSIYHTTDGGATWVSSFKYYWMDGGFYPTVQMMDANGVGWMHNGSIHWSGSVAIDPFDHNRVFVSSGNGIFRCDNMSDYKVIPAGTFDSTTNYYYSSDEAVQGQVWHYSAHGIEETVPYEVVSIPGGPLVTVIADYDGFRHDDISKYPEHRHLTALPGKTMSIGSTWSMAYAHKSGKLVKMCAARTVDLASQSSYKQITTISPLQFSADSGKTWTGDALYGGPTDLEIKEGTVAISTDGSVSLWVPASGAKSPYRYESSNWTEVSGLNAGGDVFAVGDPENADVFYAFERTTGVFYKSSDKGKSFAKLSEPGVSYDKKFRAIPGFEGDLWLPVAERDEIGNPKGGALKHSTDGGKTWANVPGIGYCEAVGYGISKTGAGYPAIYAYGVVGDVLGVFVSDDKGETWTRVNDDGHEYGGLANGEFVMGDMNTYGVVYMSTAGRGIAARVPDSWKMGSTSSGGATGEIKITPEDSLTLNGAVAQKKPSYASVAYVHGNLDITLKLASAQIDVFDMQGKKLSSRRISKSASFPLRELVGANGSFYVQVKSAGRVLFANRIIVR